MMGEEKRDMWPNTSNNSIKTHILKHIHDRKRKEIRGGYLQPNTSNNSMKTHPLKHRHDRRREKRYVHAVATYSLTRK